MLDNRFVLQRGGPHLSFALGETRIAYAYIRKNGSSAFKRAIGFESDALIGELLKKHRWRPWKRHDFTIFVWRDPVARLVSLYRNKIIDSRNNADILRSYRSVMGEDPSTFERFIDFAVQKADPHCLPQHTHLKPIRYTHAIALDDLYHTMVQIVGEEAAEPFIKRTNISRSTEIYVSNRASSLIRKHYSGDYKLIDRILSN